MKKTISQLISSFMVLLLLLMVPYLLGLNIASDDFSKTASILDESAQSSSVLGTSDFPGNTRTYFESASITNFVYYFMGFLALISGISFVKYKLIK